MAISHVGSVADGTANRTTATTITLNFDTAAGDLILWVNTNGGANADPTLGGTVVTNGGVSFAKVDGLNGGGTTVLTGNLYAGVATGNHNGQTLIASGMTNSCASCCTVLRGAYATKIASNPVLNASGTNSLAALNAGGNSGCWLVLGLCCDDNIASSGMAATDPATVTERAEHLSSGGNDTAATSCAAAMSGTGSTGAISWTNGRGAGIYQIAVGAIFAPVGVTDVAVSTVAGTGSVPAVGVAFSASTAVGVVAGVGSVPSVTLDIGGELSPDSVANLCAWWDADDPDTYVESGGYVSQWDDKSGRSLSVVQPTSTKQPRIDTRTQNGRPVMDFDGTDDWLYNYMLLTPNQGVPVTGFIVYRFDSFQDNTFGGVAWEINADANVYLSAHKPNTDPDWFVHARSSYSYDSAHAAQSGVTLIHTIQYTGNTGDAVFRENGTDYSGGGFDGNGSNFNCCAFAAHMDGWGITCMDGFIAEVVAFNRLLTLAEIEGIEAYLTTKWLTPIEGDVSVPVNAVAGTGSVLTVTISMPTSVPVSTVAGTGTVQSVAAKPATIVAPATAAGTGTVQSVSIHTTANVAVSTVAGAGSVPSVTAKPAAAVAPATVAGVGSVPAVTISTSESTNVAVATVAGTGAVPAVGISASAVVSLGGAVVVAGSAACSAPAAGNGPVTWSQAIGAAGAGRKVVVCCGQEVTSNAPTVPTVTFDGVTMHLAKDAGLTVSTCAQVFYLDDSELPGAGTYTVSVTYTSPGGARCWGSSYVLSNAASGDPTQTGSFAGLSQLHVVASLSAAGAGGFIVAMASNGYGTNPTNIVEDSGQIDVFEYGVMDQTSFSSSVKYASGDTTVGWTYDSQNAQGETLSAAAWLPRVAGSMPAGIGSVPSVTISTGAATTVPVDAVAGTGSVPAVSIAFSGAVAPATVTGAGSVPSVGISATASVGVSAVAGTGTVQSVGIVTGTIVSVSTVAGTGSVKAPTISTTANVGLTTVAGIGSVKTVGIAFSGAAAVATVAGSGSVPTVTISTTGQTTVPVSTVAGVGSVKAVGIGLSQAVSVSAVAGTGTVPSITIHATAVVAVAAVAGIGSVRAVGVSAGATISVATVAGVGSVPAVVGRAVAAPAVATVAGVGTVQWVSISITFQYPPPLLVLNVVRVLLGWRVSTVSEGFQATEVLEGARATHIVGESR